MTVFFPGCKFKAWWGDSIAQMTDFVLERGWADRVAGACCRARTLDVQADEQVLCICNSCISSVRHRCDNKVISFWTLLADDETVELPRYDGRRIALHRCGFFSYPAVESAISQVLKRMEVEVLDCEKPERAPEEERTQGFHGLAHIMGPAVPFEGPGQGKLGFEDDFPPPPWLAQKDAKGRRAGDPGFPGSQGPGFPPPKGSERGPRPGFPGGPRPPMPEEELRQRETYLQSVEGDELLCYCTGCFGSLGGAEEAPAKKLTNIVELVFPPRR